MSKLALLIGANPRRCLEGPVVRLPSGRHIIRVEGLVDSALSFCVDGVDCEYVHDSILVLELPADVQVNFSQRGSELFINVTAERAA